MGSSQDECASQTAIADMTTPQVFALCAQVCYHWKNPRAESRLVARAVEGLLVGILEGEGGRGAVLPRLGAEVVVEARAGGHGLGVEVGGEGAILKQRTHVSPKHAPPSAQCIHTITRFRCANGQGAATHRVLLGHGRSVTATTVRERGKQPRGCPPPSTW